ncbi:MAG: FAD/NAD(P)-binding protein [Deltaproteobacteria bacterium]|nr:FAD/NAD(P)-binding protein [Deltaproteobacteria bacterium]
MTANPYLPFPCRLDGIEVENEERDIKTFKLAFLEAEHAKAFAYMPGQFAELSLPGFGEAPFGIASSPTEAGFVLFSVKRVGVFTSELHASECGRLVGVRGPLGKAFPWEAMQGKDLVVVGGGFAFTTLRSAIVYALDEKNRKDFGTITVIYGARTPGELLYRSDLDAWSARKDIELHVTVDRGDEAWKGHVGVVPKILEQTAPKADRAMAIVCGPPIMIKYTLPVIDKLGFSPKTTVLSLENRMKCGIGKCGRCNIGPRFVCVDGPVFTREELSALPQEY